MEEEFGIQLVPTFYIFCGLKEAAERDLQDLYRTVVVQYYY
jgi:hypothetical protein